MGVNNHVWSFSTIGGVKRVNLETGSDLVHLKELDPKLWTVLSCPVNGLEIDSKTLELIDADKDGHIRIPEVIDAVNWIVSIIKDPNDLLKQSGQFPLSALNENSEDGRILLGSAKAILKNLKRENETSLTVEDTSDTVKIFAETRFNGDGVITEDTADGDETATALINEIIKCADSTPDRNGKQGITLDILNSFLTNCEQYANWQNKASADNTILPFGVDTPSAYDSYRAVKAKVDDYFLRCRLAVYHPASETTLNLQIAQVEAIATKNLPSCIEEIAAYPLADITANGQLPLSSGINPAWATQVQTFKEQAVSRQFAGKDSINETDWARMAEIFAPYEKWASEKEGQAVESLGITRVTEILTGATSKKLVLLIEQDRAMEVEANNIILVDKVVRYYRDLYALLKNFVTFYDFYNGSRAVFQAGTLYIDQRSADLCIRVQDIARQDSLASYSGIYLLYCDCVSKTTNQRMVIAAAITNGDVDDLMAGRNAVFFDRNGLDWDATIVKIKENPISIRQAFFAPYRKLMQFVEKQINKAAADQDEKISENLKKSAETMEKEGKEEKETPQAVAAAAEPFDVGKFAGIFAAIGLALGAIGSVSVAILSGFLKLAWWQMPFALITVLLIVSGPSMTIAFLKLRKRNLAPLLEANGWAINSRVKINIPFGRTLTHLAALPKDAKVNLIDPFVKKRNPFLPTLLLILAIAVVVLFVLLRKGVIHVHF